MPLKELKKICVRFGGSTDFSGYDREHWECRSKEQHYRDVDKVMKEVTKTGIQKAQSELGVRYSTLLALPYFDPVRFTAIDAMHNLFLGTAKHCFGLWVDKGFLTKQKLNDLECKAKMFCVPAGIGRLPCSFSSCYGAFTASQWKNWITIYSPILKLALPQDDFRCWLLFVRSCSILCSHCIRQSDITSADMFLIQFCRQFERLYDGKSCSFNMHLHMHLKQTFLDFGPPHASWCFVFERFNGILGSYHTNKKAIESQIMRKFCRSQAIYSLDISVHEDLSTVLPPGYQQDISSKVPSDSLRLLHYARSSLDLINTFVFDNTLEIDPLAPYYNDVFDAELAEQLENLYNQLYPQKSITSVSRFYSKFGRITIAGDLIGSDMPGPNSRTSSVVMAYWPSRGKILRITSITLECKSVLCNTSFVMNYHTLSRTK